MKMLENSFDWDYIENEGNGVIRFDFTSRGEPTSLWFYSHTNSLEGVAPKRLKSNIQKMTELDIEFLKFI